MKRTERQHPWPLPTGWKWVALEEVATIINGLSYEKSRIIQGTEADACLVLRSGNIQHGRIVTGEQDVYLPLAEVQQEQLVRNGDVLLVSSTGSQKSIGKAGIVADMSGPCSFGAFLFLLRPQQAVDSRYFASFFFTPYYRQQVAWLARGSSINNLKRTQLARLLFPLPPLAEQQQLADRLAKLQDKLTEAKRLIDAGAAFLQQAQHGLLDAVFAGRFSPDQMDWPTVPLGSLIQLGTGEPLSRARMNASGPFPVYGGNGVSGFHDAANCEQETIVIGRVGTNCGSVYLTPPRAWITDNALIASFDRSRLDMRFLFYALRQLQLRQYSNSSAQPVLSGKTIYPLALRLPPLAEQRRLVALLDAQLNRLEEASTHVSKADVELIEQQALQQAFAGNMPQRAPVS